MAACASGAGPGPQDGFETGEEALIRDIRTARYVFSQFKRVFPDERYDVPYSPEWAEDAGYFKLDIAVVPAVDPWISLSVALLEDPARGEEPDVQVELRLTDAWSLEPSGSCRLGGLLQWTLDDRAARRLHETAEGAAAALSRAAPSIPRRRDVIYVDDASFHAAMVTREGVASWHRQIGQEGYPAVYDAVRPLILAFAEEEPALSGYLTLLDDYLASGGEDAAAARAMERAFSAPPACARP